MAAHRLAHRPWSTRWGRPGAQAIATASAKTTGITMHPGAVIGHRLFIDHGSEVVVPVMLRPRARFSAGTVVTHDVPAGTTVVGIDE